MQALFQAALASFVDAAEQQVFEQVRQLFLLATEVIQADADHQANRHMVTFITVFQDDLQAIGQQVTFNPRAVEGE